LAALAAPVNAELPPLFLAGINGPIFTTWSERLAFGWKE
jgi:hypothetical protein